MDLDKVRKGSRFHSAISAVELLSLEDQAMLIEIFQNRLQEQKYSQLDQETEEVDHGYTVSNFEFSSIDDFLAELEI